MKKINNLKKNEYWMEIALFFARVALNQGEIPVGAILVHKNKIIGVGWNNSIKKNDPTGHAEILALRKGGMYLKNYRLLKSTLYVTLEPCLMCLGAVLNSRIQTLVIGANQKKINNFLYLSKFILKNKKLKIEVIKNVLKRKCSFLLKNFFLTKR
ncbi:tRNA adenosine(34) deaminase TadA [Buchnera aphidicola]|uniref:tRNA adenosine(34) deaminase TadA n=1 Tax=Buchnera aphidicola TaxID=9 RepID=UPI0020922A08|nr:tRNA adenosine(34) deaminase TadA [Buchnera aphidicola]USS94298.1 tRNA adenosine(34) deaminase TadA [Buchnera aphidicola (Sipha maydis)]WII23848.1 tRNA adenosine(34) deaminase TadA [Buchnera aphidicola (Sipha maydis)]